MVGVKQDPPSSNSNRGLGSHCSVCQPNDPLRLFKLKSLCVRQPHWKTYGLLFNLLLSFLLLYIVEHTSLLFRCSGWSTQRANGQYLFHLDRQLIFPSRAKCQTLGILSIIWTPVYCPNWNTSLHLLDSACQSLLIDSIINHWRIDATAAYILIYHYWLTVCLVILVGRKKSHSHHFWVVLYQLIVPGPFSCSAVDQSLLIFLFLPLLPGSHSQQTQAHSGCSSLCEEELVTGSCLLRGPDWDWLRFWAPTVQLVFPSVGGREVCRTFKWCN